MGAVGTLSYSLSSDEKAKITKGIEDHTKEQNDNAEIFYITNIDKEKEIVNNYQSYLLSGKIKSKDDEWWQHHENTYKNLTAQYNFFLKERKRLGK